MVFKFSAFFFSFFNFQKLFIKYSFLLLIVLSWILSQIHINIAAGSGYGSVFKKLLDPDPQKMNADPKPCR